MANVTTATTTVSIDGSDFLPCDVLIEQNIEYVTSAYASKPDPKWSFTDGAGHFHAFTKAKDRSELPTLRAEEVPCDGACGDPEDTVTVYRCIICGETVEPGYIPDYDAMTRGFPIPGPKRAEVTVFADGPHGNRTVSLRIKAGDMEMIGIGEVVATGSDGRTQVSARFIEPRI